MISDDWPNGTYEILEGPEAVQKIQSILRPNEECIKLAEDVCGFYGTDLKLGLNNDQPLSITLPYQSLQPDEMRIILVTGTDREREALSHELLHAQLLAQGLPFPSLCESAQMAALNIVHHKLIFKDYQNNLKLAPNKFYGPTDFIDRAAVKMALQKREDEQYKTYEWCLRLCGDWLNWMLTKDENYVNWLQHDWGLPHVQRHYPELTNELIEQIKTWFDRNLDNPNTFVLDFNQLLQILGVPKIECIQWFFLTKDCNKDKPDRHRMNGESSHDGLSPELPGQINDRKS